MSAELPWMSWLPTPAEDERRRFVDEQQLGELRRQMAKLERKIEAERDRTEYPKARVGLSTDKRYVSMSIIYLNDGSDPNLLGRYVQGEMVLTPGKARMLGEALLTAAADAEETRAVMAAAETRAVMAAADAISAKWIFD